MVGRAGNCLRVQRGGSFNNEASNARCAYRNENNPALRNDWNNNGFRCGVGAAHISLLSLASNAVCLRTRRRGQNVD